MHCFCLSTTDSHHESDRRHRPGYGCIAKSHGPLGVCERYSSLLSPLSPPRWALPDSRVRAVKYYRHSLFSRRPCQRARGSCQSARRSAAALLLHHLLSLLPLLPQLLASAAVAAAAEEVAVAVAVEAALAVAAASARQFRRPSRVQTNRWNSRNGGHATSSRTSRRRLRVLHSGLEGADPAPAPSGSALSGGCPLPIRAWGSLPFHPARA